MSLNQEVPLCRGKISSKDIRKRIGHPVIDADGHWLEFGPSITDYLKDVAGNEAVNSFRRRGGYVVKSLAMTPEERAKRVAPRKHFGACRPKIPSIARPRCCRDCCTIGLDEFGFDFTVLYPTAGLAVGYIPEEEVRRATCRAFNMYIAHQFGEFSDRMTPAAAIPMHTPQEAIDELEYAVKVIGLKVVVMTSMVPRPIAATGQSSAEMRSAGTWPDVFLGPQSPLQLRRGVGKVRGARCDILAPWRVPA